MTEHDTIRHAAETAWSYAVQAELMRVNRRFERPTRLQHRIEHHAVECARHALYAAHASDHHEANAHMTAAYSHNLAVKAFVNSEFEAPYHQARADLATEAINRELPSNVEFDNNAVDEAMDRWLLDGTAPIAGRPEQG